MQKKKLSWLQHAGMALEISIGVISIIPTRHSFSLSHTHAHTHMHAHTHTQAPMGTAIGSKSVFSLCPLTFWPSAGTFSWCCPRCGSFFWPIYSLALAPQPHNLPMLLYHLRKFLFKIEFTFYPLLYSTNWFAYFVSLYTDYCSYINSWVWLSLILFTFFSSPEYLFIYFLFILSGKL